MLGKGAGLDRPMHCCSTARHASETPRMLFASDLHSPTI